MSGRPFRMSGSGREALPDVREWLGGPPGCPGVVCSRSQMSGTGQETLSDVWELLGGPFGCLGVV